MSDIDGRGRWLRVNSRPSTNDYINFDILNFSKSIDFNAPCSGNCCFGEEKFTVNFAVIPGRGVIVDYRRRDKDYRYLITVETTLLNFGGVRFWWRCPNESCKRRVRILYTKNDYFLCRTCHNLNYPSSQAGDDLTPRIDNRLLSIRRKLGATGSILASLPEKPSKMRKNTYSQLCTHYNQLVTLRAEVCFVDMGRILKVAYLSDLTHKCLHKVWKEIKYEFTVQPGND